MDYFSRKRRGGVVGSKIEHQDVVATFLAIDLLSRKSPYSRMSIVPSNWKIVSEGYDDLEILLERNRVYVQVKATPITPKLLNEILLNFEKNAAQVQSLQSDTMCYFHVYALEGLSPALHGIEQQLEELRNSQHHYTPQEYQAGLHEFAQKYNLPTKLLPLSDAQDGEEVSSTQTASFPECGASP